MIVNTYRCLFAKDFPSPLPPEPVASFPKPAGRATPDRRAITMNAQIDAGEIMANKGQRIKMEEVIGVE